MLYFILKSFIFNMFNFTYIIAFSKTIIVYHNFILNLNYIFYSYYFYVKLAPKFMTCKTYNKQFKVATINLDKRDFHSGYNNHLSSK